MDHEKIRAAENATKVSELAGGNAEGWRAGCDVKRWEDLSIEEKIEALRVEMKGALEYMYSIQRGVSKVHEIAHRHSHSPDGEVLVRAGDSFRNQSVGMVRGRSRLE